MDIMSIDVHSLIFFDKTRPLRNEVAPLPRTGQCSPCGAGFSTRSIASTSCFRCKVGTYRSDEVQCVTCPGKKTTAYQGGNGMGGAKGGGSVVNS